MAIREYIGARYVPRFMGTYDNTQIYEALDVVDNGMGTSYISKIPTPAGTPLTNTTYWTIYGATSGAIINLQNQINNLNSDVELLKENAFNVVDLGADNTGSTDNATLFNQLFNSADYNRKLFYFPSGVYNIGAIVTINNGASIIMAPDAVIKATATMQAMFAFNTEAVTVPHVATPHYNNAHRYIMGGIFDAQHLAARCINMRQYFDTKIDSIAFYNVEIAIDTTSNLGTENLGQGAELLIENCRVQNTLDYTLPSIGFKVANDNIIDNCFFVNVSEPIILTAGGNALSNVHGWTYNNALALISKFIQTSGATNYANNLYCDNIPCCIYWNGNGYFMLNNCRILLDSIVNGYTGALFDGASSGTLSVANIVISSDYDFDFCDSAHDRYGSIDGFQSQNNNCLPIQPEYTNADWNKYTNARPITTLDGIKSGTYAGTALGRPTGVSWCYYDVKKFNGGNYLMCAYATAGKLFYRFGKWNDPWYNVDGSGSVPAVTS